MEGPPSLDELKGGAILFYNPGSTRAQRAAGHLLNTGMIEVETSRERDKTVADLRSALPTNDKPCVVFVAGGDGSMSTAAEAMQGTRSVMRPLRAGNAGDLFAVHGRQTRKRAMPADLVRGHGVMPLYPLEIDVQDGSLCGQQYFAASYFSVGIGGGGSAVINLPEHRERPGYAMPPVRGVYDALAVLRALVQMPPVIVIENGVPRSAVDITVTRSPRMARYLSYPQRPEDSSTLVAELRSKRLRHIAPYLFGVVTGQGHYRRMAPDEQLELFIESAAFAQRDGEEFLIKPGSVLAAKRSKTPFYVLSRRAA